MNIPKRASRHHFIRASRCSGDSTAGCAAKVDATNRQIAARQRSRFFIGPGPYPARTDDLLGVSETLWPTELTARSHSYAKWYLPITANQSQTRRTSTIGI